MATENYLLNVEEEGGMPWLVEKFLMLLGPRGEDNEANEEVVKRTRRQRRNASIPLRREVTSCLLAAIARNDDRVKAFRGKYLSGGLLKPENVESWIHASKNVGRFRHAIVLSLPKETDMLQLKLRSEILAPLLQGNRMENVAPVDCLSYPDVSSGYLKKLPVWRDGTLRILYELTNDLAKLYAWNPADALMFVLTDYTPPVTLYEFTLHGPPSVVTETQSQTLNLIGCLSRVTITVDPFTTPREVAELYAPVRRNLLKGRPKSLNEKQMYLACFIAGHETPPRALMMQWNEKYPKWKYGRFSLFSRDSRRAKAILLGEGVFDLKKASEREPLISIRQPN